MISNYQLTGLSASTGYIVSAFSSNAKGRSDRLNFHVFTGESKQPQIGGAGLDESVGKADKADQLLAETSESALTKSAVAGSSKKSSEVSIVPRLRGGGSCCTR